MQSFAGMKPMCGWAENWHEVHRCNEWGSLNIISPFSVVSELLQYFIYTLTVEVLLSKYNSSPVLWLTWVWDKGNILYRQFTKRKVSELLPVYYQLLFLKDALSNYVCLFNNIKWHILSFDGFRQKNFNIITYCRAVSDGRRCWLHLQLISVYTPETTN